MVVLRGDGGAGRLTAIGEPRPADRLVTVPGGGYLALMVDNTGSERDGLVVLRGHDAGHQQRHLATAAATTATEIHSSYY